MPPLGDQQQVPLGPEGDLVVSDEDEMAARVAAAKERYRNAQPVHPREPNPLGPNQLSYISEQIAAADKAQEKPARASRKPAGPVAPVRRGKAPASRLHKPVVPLSAPPAPEPEPAAKKRKPPAKRRVAPSQIEDISDEDLLVEAGVVQYFSTIEAAQFFDRTTQWMYWGLGRDDETPIFVYPDGTPILPERVGDPLTGRRRFTLAHIKDILKSSYKRGNIEQEELKKILRRIRINEMGGEWREREGWHKIRGKWVHPSECVEVEGTWVRRKKILRRIRINEMGGEWREREGWHKIRGKWVHPSECVEVEGTWVRRKKIKPSGDDDV